MPVQTLSVIDSTKIAQYSFDPSSKKRTPENLKLDHPWEQCFSDTVSLVDPIREKYLKDPKQFDTSTVTDPKKLVETYKDSIEMHLDQRVALFFQTALVCYKMPFHFESSGEAEDQYGSAPSITKSRDSAAAHSSTIPCLYATPIDEWERYQTKLSTDKTAQKPRKFVYLKYSHCYQLQNSTNALPVVINEADSLIDWKAKGTLLRDTTLRLINEVARGNIDPTKATREFLTSLKSRVKVIIKERPDHKTSLVMEKYLERVEDIQLNLSISNGFFDDLLNVKVNEKDARAQKLRDVVYKKRFEIIRNEKIIDARIKHRLTTANVTIEKGESRKLLKLALLMESKGHELTALQKLFSTTVSYFNKDYEKSLETDILNKKKAIGEAKNKDVKKELEIDLKKLEKTLKSYLDFKGRLQSFTTRNKTALDNLLRDIRADMREVVSAEVSFRAGLLKDLIGNVNDWHQKDFVKKFKEKFPTESMSDSMVSRLVQPVRMARKVQYKTPESQRRKEISVEKAQKCAKTLNVDAGLFFPCVFTSKT